MTPRRVRHKVNLATQPNREDILSYITDNIIGGLTKKDSYLKNINADIKDTNKAIQRLEKTDNFQMIYQSVVNDDSLKLQIKVKKVQSKYVELMDKNLDTAIDVLDAVKGTKGSITEKAVAVRLVNETIGAMAIVNGPTQAQKPGELDRSGVIQ